MLKLQTELVLVSENVPRFMCDDLEYKLDPDKDASPEEIEERELARKNMRHYVQYTFPGYKADYFHLHACDYIDRVVHKERPDHITHLMLYAPPQHGKSEIVSTRLPGYWLAHNPELPIALMSYGDDLALRNSVNAREVVESPAYQRLFDGHGIVPDKTKWRKRDWHLMGKKGFVRAASMRGRITGEGFGLGIVDDPIKDFAEAQSDTVRESLWSWWKGTFKTRFWEDHCMIFMMTRWNEDDLAARVLQSEGNLNVCVDCSFYMPHDIEPEKCPECGGPRGKWKVLIYPALSESQEDRDKSHKDVGLPEGLPDILGRDEDKPLAPSRFSEKYLKLVRNEVGELVWLAEYQQHPTPPKGDFFKVGRVEIEPIYPLEAFGGELINQIPVGCNRKVVRYWDLAATEEERGKDPDWTVGALVGIDESTGLSWVLNEVRIKADPSSVEEMIKQTAKIDGKRVKIRIEQEPGAAGKSLVAGYIKMLQGYHVEGRPSSGAKEVRAYNFSSQVNAGNVRLVDAPWNGPWLAIHRSFPFGKFDDDVDATSGAYNEVAMPIDRYRQRFKHL